MIGYHTLPLPTGSTPPSRAPRRARRALIVAGGLFEGVVDADALLRDSLDPARLNPAYDSGDHLHPNPAGLAAPGNGIPLDELAIASVQ